MTSVIEEPKRNRSHSMRIAVLFAAVVLQSQVGSGGAFRGLLKATRAGVSFRGAITVRPDLSDAETFRTLAHEVAHELLHKGQRRQETTKTIREAEAVVFAVGLAVGLDVNTSSSDYIQLYNGSVETLTESLDHIRRCTDIILSDLLSDEAPSPASYID